MENYQLSTHRTMASVVCSDRFPCIQFIFRAFDENLALLAQEHLWLNNLEEAGEKAKEAMEAATAHTKGQDNVYQAYAEGILGEVQFAEGNYKEAALHFHNALGNYERHERTSTGPESVMLVAATQLVSWMSLAKNESSIEAQIFARTALAMTERLLGPK